MTLGAWFPALLTKGPIIEIRDSFHQKPAMRGPFSVTHRVDQEMAERSMFSGLPELSDLGWFNEGSGSLSQERTSLKRHLRKGIHKETPMFSTLFQEKTDIIVRLHRVLVGFLAGITGKQRKNTLSQSK